MRLTRGGRTVGVIMLLQTGGDKLGFALCRLSALRTQSKVAHHSWNLRKQTTGKPSKAEM